MMLIKIKGWAKQNALMMLLSVGVVSLSTNVLAESRSVEERLQFLEDQYEIEQLAVVKYANALDAFDGKAYAALFTKDGVLDLVGNEFKGQKAIEEMFTNPASMGPPPKPGEEPVPFEMPTPEPGQILVPHVITNTSYAIDGDTATGRCYFQEITTVAGKVEIINSGHYDDVLRKEDGVWKFVRRNIMQDHPPASSFK